MVGLSTTFRQLLYFSDDINSTIRLFADDSVVYRQINSPDDHRILQEDLQKLVEWSKTWKMEFNVDKYAIMNFGTLRNISKFDYKIKTNHCKL